MAQYRPIPYIHITNKYTGRWRLNVVSIDTLLTSIWMSVWMRDKIAPEKSLGYCILIDYKINLFYYLSQCLLDFRLSRERRTCASLFSWELHHVMYYKQKISINKNKHKTRRLFYITHMCLYKLFWITDSCVVLRKAL